MDVSQTCFRSFGDRTNRLRATGKPRRVASRRRRGASAVEFAVVSPLFFLLLAGIVEFGEAFRIEHMLSNACRRGARAAVVDGATSSQVQQLVKTHCVDTLGVSNGDVTVQISVNGNATMPLSSAEESDEIGVTVTVPYSKAGTGFYAMFFSSSNLSATCKLEHE